MGPAVAQTCTATLQNLGRQGGTHHALQLPARPPPIAVAGVLKGYDQLLNLVLDEAVEYLRGMRLWPGQAASHRLHMWQPGVCSATTSPLPALRLLVRSTKRQHTLTAPYHTTPACRCRPGGPAQCDRGDADARPDSVPRDLRDDGGAHCWDGADCKPVPGSRTRMTASDGCDAVVGLIHAAAHLVCCCAAVTLL